MLAAFVLRRTVAKGANAGFTIEMPRYQMPLLRDLLIGLWQRAWVFLRRAGTIIMLVTVALWLLASYPQAPEGVRQSEYSIAGRIASGLEVVVRPIGFNHEMALAIIPAMAAREVAVSALQTVYAIDAPDEEAGATQLGERLSRSWPLPTALAFLAWFVFAPQCLSTIAVTRRETNGWRWPLFMLGYLFALAYLAAGATYLDRDRARTLGETPMAGVNKVILVGNLGDDPEARSLNNGGEVVNLRVATSENWKDKDGNRQERTEWHRVVIFNENLGRVAKNYLKKGSKVYLEGQIQTRKWQDQAGQDHYSTEVVLQRFRGELVLLDSKGGGGGGGYGDDQGGGDYGGGQRAQPQGRPQPAFDSDLDDDVPSRCPAQREVATVEHAKRRSRPAARRATDVRFFA